MSKLNVIAPYRNRESHLNVFVDVMYEFLRNSKIDSFEIYIVEQCDDKDFNRGCLLNIGFLEAMTGDNDYYCFNDIDTLPQSEVADYSRPMKNTISHPYGHFHSLSNFFLIDSDTFKNMNGFSTKYWVWGFEDLDLMLRAKLNDVQIIRNNFTERFKSNVYYELDNQNKSDLAKKMSNLSTKINEVIFYNSIFNPENTVTDGLNTTSYNLLKKEKRDKFTLLKCEITNRNENLKKINSLQDYQNYMNALNAQK